MSCVSMNYVIRNVFPIFDGSVTIKLHHEFFFFHVVQRGFGLRNLPQIRSLMIAGFKDRMGGGSVTQLPKSLQSLLFYMGRRNHFSTLQAPEAFSGILILKFFLVGVDIRSGRTIRMFRCTRIRVWEMDQH